MIVCIKDFLLEADDRLCARDVQRSAPAANPWFDEARRHGVFRCFVNHGSRYEPLTEAWFADIGLGLLLWQGSYEDAPETTWLRWCGADRQLIATGRELAAMVQSQADQERQTLERLEAKLRALGIDPKSV